MKDKSIAPYNDKYQRHGYWEVYIGNTIWYKCFFHNGYQIGYEENHLPTYEPLKEFYII